MTTFHNFIAGEWVRAASGQTFENRNPADTRDLVGHFPRSGAADVERAVASATRGFARWSRTPVAMCCGGSAT
jgi:acyl-CoA reductase-like NAD-dependent aldehyde dehydrogenase